MQWRIHLVSIVAISDWFYLRLGYHPTDPSPENVRKSSSIATNKPSHAPPPPPLTGYDAVGHESPQVHA